MKTIPEASIADGTRQRLLEAAIAEIEERGIAKLTVRAVAARAQANIAAVNYYFRSKDALVTAALEGSIRHMVEDSQAFLARLPADPGQVLAELLGYYLEGALRYPRVSKAQLFEAFTADDYSGPFPTLFAPVMLRLRDALRAAVPGLDERTAARRTVAALSAVFFPAFFSGLYAPVSTLGAVHERRRYVEELAQQCLAPHRDHTRGGKGARVHGGEKAR